ncbi:unnamed protein product, partial [Urochloa humidicola]
GRRQGVAGWPEARVMGCGRRFQCRPAQVVSDLALRWPAPGRSSFCRPARGGEVWVKVVDLCFDMPTS